MKKKMSVLISVLLVIFLSGPVMAAGDWRHGKKIFKVECMNCHKHGGQAERLKIDKKKKAGWTKFINSDYESVHAALSNALTEAEKEDLLSYLHKYSKDDESALIG